MNAWSEGVSVDSLLPLPVPPPVPAAAAAGAPPPPPPPNDGKTALAALIAEHGDWLFSLCVRVVRDPSLAEEILQQSILEAVRDFGRFQGRSSLRTWISGIVLHRCQDALQARRRHRQRIEPDDQKASELPDPGASPIEQLAHAQVLTALEGCLATLSPPVRAAVLLRFQGGMSYEEMARVLGVKADTLSARVARALPVIRRCLEAKGWSP